MQVVVNNLLTSYIDTAKDAKIIILLHGWADSGNSFAELRKNLGERYRVISVDLPGAGGTEPPPGAWGLDDLADFIAAFLQKIGAGTPFALIGHSNGGAIAIRGLATGRLRADRLVLLASAGIRSRQTGRKLVFKIIAKTGKAASIMLPVSARQRLRSKLYKAAGSDMLVAEHLQETFKKVVGQDVVADARLLQIPTLLLYGRNDSNTPSSYGEELHQAIKGSRLEIIDGAGHHLHHDQPQKVLDLVQEFLNT